MTTQPLNERTALVTGGGSGIGRGIARGLAEAGARVVLVGSSDRPGDVAEQLRAEGHDATALRCDLSDRDALVTMFGEALTHVGHLDVLVNCHGIATASPTVDHALEDWDRTLEVNLTSVFELCQLAGRHMLERANGRIINIASMYAHFGGLKVAAYTASKAGVAQLTKALSNEWAASGITVNAIAPGYIRTDLNRHVWEDPERSAEILSRIPAGRWGEPDDMADPVVFLASDAARYITGAVIPVDGGFLAR